MDEQEKEETDAEETEGSTDIQGYLASFNKEIQSGNNQGDAQDTDKQGDNCYVTHVTDSGELQEYQYGADSEGVFTTTYYATADGSLYAANPHQGNINQQIAFHTLAPSNSQDQGAGSDRGLQQLVLAVNDSNCLAFSDNKAISVVIPTSISSQLEQVNGQKEISARPGNSTKNHQPKFITAKPKCLKQEIEESKVSDTEEMECEEVADDSNSKPQTVMVIQESNIEGQQMIPVSNSGQTIVSGIGEELHIDEQRTLQMMASLAEQAAASKVSVNSENATLLSDGNSYQTVTIVPSDTNPGELSYVLFVSQADDPSEKSEDNVDLSIYDFNDGERHAESFLAIDDGTEDSKMHTIRVTPRRSQIVIQQHMCRYCNYTSPKRYLLSRHMKSHSDERPHKCNVCGRGFKTLASLQNHVNTHTGIRPHACKDCDSCFTTSGELVRHVRYKHTHEKPHRCSECDYASVELSKLKRHMRCHTGERPYQCPHCTYASPDTYKLKRHLRIHTGEKPYECDICLSRFTQSNSLKAHKLIHSGNKPVFHCQYCPATCGRKTDLRIHVQKLHSCDRPHRCKRCGKVFADRYSFKLHSKSHEGEKCYKCDLCSYASISRRHLDTHMLVHTDQKPYRCVECGQCFRQKQLLKRHKNLYHDPNYVPPVPKEKINECSECDKAFRHKGNLLRHLAVHDPDASSAERAEAMRIGQPKGPGELEDGEEDDYMDDDDELEKGKDSQQVVVFEVIQLPSANGSNTEGQTLTTADGQTVSLSGSNSQGFTIIQQAPDEGDIADQSQDSLLSDSEGENILKDQLVAGNVSRVSYEAPRRRGRPRKYPLLTEVQPDYSNQSLVSIDHNDTTSMDKRTHHLRKKKFGDADYIDDIYISNSPARRGRPPKNPYRSPKIVQIVAEKKTPVELNDSLPTIITIQDGELIVRSEKTLVEKCIQQKPKDMEECFGFDNNEDDSMLTISATSDYQAFHNTVEDDDAT